MGFERFICWGDTHGDYVDRPTLRALEKHIKEFKPKHRICLGDAFDFRSLRKGISNAESDSMDDLVSDWNAGMMMFHRLRPHVFLAGNHDHRLWRVADDAANGLVRQYARDGITRIERELKKIQCRFYPYHYQRGVHRIRKVAFVHGFTANMASVKQHAEIFAEPGGAVCMGHIHRIEAVNAIRHGGAKGYSGGCICDIEKMTYAHHRTATARWEHGWLYGVIGSGGEYKIWQSEKVGKVWMHP